MHPPAQQLLIGLDLNASRARAVAGPAHAPPQPLPLEGRHEELPLYLSLEGPAVEVGRAGLALCRRWPHLACHGFLAHLGSKRQWLGNGHKLDAAMAVKAVARHLRPAFGEVGGVTVAAPAYLDGRQGVLLRGLLEEARWPGLGVGAAPPGAGLAAPAEQAVVGAPVAP